MHKNIYIIGLGGVGGYFGFKLNAVNESNNIHFVARGETLEKVQANGLILKSPEVPEETTHPTSVISDISQIKDADLILVCVKEYDLEKVCEQLAPNITDTTVLMPFMNGADIYERVRKIIPSGIVLPSCVYVASHIEEKGIISHKGKTGKIVFGRDPQNQDANIEWIEKLLKESKVVVSFEEDAFPGIWTKFIFIASFGLVTARYNEPMGAVCKPGPLHDRAWAIMEEIKKIADAKEIGLPEDIIPVTFEKASTFPGHSPTSLQLDVNSDKAQNELELFAGAIIRYGKELSIDTPATQSIYEEIKEVLEK